MKQRRKPTVLVLSQVYVPDPTSVGQHMADAAEAIAARGYRVVVLTSSRGYDDPSIKYPSRETRGGVEIVRLPLSSFGKSSIPVRLLGAGLFLLQTVVRGLFTGRLAAILVSTSPPMCSAAALAIGGLRRVPVKYWVMDQNPDQMIALGRIREDGLAARTFNRLNRRILGRADDVIVLDRFMAQRVCRKRDVLEKLTVLPPWPHEDVLEPVAREENPFIERHGLRDKLVIMYSGNHSIASPLTTLLEAALALRDDPRLHFMFIGGGLGKQEVDDVIARHRPSNMVSLPYQPLSEIKYSLPAADVHVVSLGDTMVGIVHPCKIYGAMAVGRPILMLGPSPSHAADLIDEHHIGWKVAHGDVPGAVDVLREIRRAAPEHLAVMGATARRVIREQLSKQVLCGEFCDVVLRGVRAAEVVPAVDARQAAVTTTDRRGASADRTAEPIGPSDSNEQRSHATDVESAATRHT